jgi:hypothetical protein
MKDILFSLMLLEYKISQGDKFMDEKARSAFIDVLKTSGYKDLMEVHKKAKSFKLLEIARDLGLINFEHTEGNSFGEGERPETSDLVYPEFYESRRIIELIFEQL